VRRRHQDVKTTSLIAAVDSEQHTNSIIEKKIDFFQNENRFLEKNEINIPRCDNSYTESVENDVF